MFFDPFSFSFAFSAVPFLVTIGFVVVIGLILFSAIRGFATWSHNNRQPVLTVRARVVTKRMNVRRTAHHHHHDHHHVHSRTSTTYYATFEVDSGDRLEFCISGSEYGMLAEGDVGDLTFQGTRYLSFHRYP